MGCGAYSSGGQRYRDDVRGVAVYIRADSRCGGAGVVGGEAAVGGFKRDMAEVKCQKFGKG